LGAYQLLLARYCGQTDVCVGVMDEPGNTLPLRIDLSSNPIIIHFLHSVNEVAQEAFEHQPVPFKMLPPLPIAFVWQNLQIVEQIAETNYEIALCLKEEDEKLAGVIEYNAELFSADTIQQIARHYTHVLEFFTEHPLQTLQGIPLLKTAELKEILH